MVTNRNFFKSLGRKAAILGLASASLLGVSGCSGAVKVPVASDPPAVGGSPVPGEPSEPASPSRPQTPTEPTEPAENRAPVITSSPVTEVNEGSAYSYQVTARDPDGDDMNFTLPTKPEWLSMSSGGLIAGVAPEVNLDTDVDLEARVSDGKATTSHPFTIAVKDVLPTPPPSGGGGGSPSGGGGSPSGGGGSPSPTPSSPPSPMLTVSGTLQNSETDDVTYEGDPVGGEVRAYKDDGDGTYTRLGRTMIESDGSFSMSFRHSGNFDLQARLKQGTTYKSYVRTIPMSSNSDLTRLTIRAVPYTDLLETQTVSKTDTFVSTPEFKSFMEDVNNHSSSRIRGGFTRWNLGDLNGIEILKYNPLTSNTGEFTSDNQNHIVSRINASDDIKILFNGRTVTVQKDDTSANQDMNKKYSVLGSEISPNQGWIVVVPVSDLSAFGTAKTRDTNNDGYFDYGLIRLKSNADIYKSGSDVITHEFAHATLYPGGDTDGHTNRLVNDHTIISKTGVAGRTACSKPCTFDKKAARLIYEVSFATGTPYDEILGTDWKRE